MAQPHKAYTKLYLLKRMINRKSLHKFTRLSIVMDYIFVPKYPPSKGLNPN